MRRLHMKEAVETKRLKGNLSGEEYIFGSVGGSVIRRFYYVCALLFSSPNKSLKNITINIFITII
jgi:hypothetical protein